MASYMSGDTSVLRLSSNPLMSRAQQYAKDHPGSSFLKQPIIAIPSIQPVAVSPTIQKYDTLSTPKTSSDNQAINSYTKQPSEKSPVSLNKILIIGGCIATVIVIYLLMNKSKAV